MVELIGKTKLKHLRNYNQVLPLKRKITCALECLVKNIWLQNKVLHIKI